MTLFSESHVYVLKDGKMDIKELTDIARLVEKHLQGELSPQEKESLNEWLSRSEENRVVFRRLCSETFIEQWRSEELLFNPEEAYVRFAAERSACQKKRRSFRFTGYVAASVLVLLGITVGIWKMKFSDNRTEPFLLHSGSSMATLTLDDGRVIAFAGGMRDTLLEEGVQLLVSGKGIEYKAGQGSLSRRYNELEVPRKGEFFLLLSDGTKVWVNSETRMRYPVVFDSTERVVELEGEAFFKVHQDLARPFRVRMKDLGTVEVTGTSFNVHNYADEDMIRVTLEEGAVRLFAGNESEELEPGEQGYFAPGESLGKKKVNVNLFTDWKNGRFVFKEQSLEDIMQTVARWYDVQVEFANESVQKVTFTGNIRRYDDFSKIIRMLEAVKVARFEISGNRIYVSEYIQPD